MEGLLLRLALAGPAGYLKNALLRSRLGCLHASRRRSRVWPGGGDGGMRGWTGNRFARLSPTSGLARMGRRRGAQLDGEFAVYASRRRLRASPGGGGGGARCLGPEFAFLSFTHQPLDARPSYAWSLVPSKTVDQTLPP